LLIARVGFNQPMISASISTRFRSVTLLDCSWRYFVAVRPLLLLEASEALDHTLERLLDGPPALLKDVYGVVLEIVEEEERLDGDICAFFVLVGLPEAN
jgi:hypothetical protein